MTLWSGWGLEFIWIGKFEVVIDGVSEDVIIIMFTLNCAFLFLFLGKGKFFKNKINKYYLFVDKIPKRKNCDW